MTTPKHSTTILVFILAIMGGAWIIKLQGDTNPTGVSTGESSMEDHAHELHFYVREPSDPNWLVRTGEFHGHLGPWVVMGAMIGRDALGRLATQGYWDIDVTVWLPPEHQRQPWTCILDGLQVSTGATLGKRNIHLRYSADIVKNQRPVVFVTSLPSQQHQARGVAYRVNDRLAQQLAAITPHQLEAVSRTIAKQRVEELTEVREMSPTECRETAGAASERAD